MLVSVARLARKKPTAGCFTAGVGGAFIAFRRRPAIARNRRDAVTASMQGGAGGENPGALRPPRPGTAAAPNRRYEARGQGVPLFGGWVPSQ